jgi:hypothetical protein
MFDLLLQPHRDAKSPRGVPGRTTVFKTDKLRSKRLGRPNDFFVARVGVSQEAPQVVAEYLAKLFSTSSDTFSSVLRVAFAFELHLFGERLPER